MQSYLSNTSWSSEFIIILLDSMFHLNKIHLDLWIYLNFCREHEKANLSVHPCGIQYIQPIVDCWRIIIIVVIIFTLYINTITLSKHVIIVGLELSTQGEGVFCVTMMHSNYTISQSNNIIYSKESFSFFVFSLFTNVDIHVSTPCTICYVSL